MKLIQVFIKQYISQYKLTKIRAKFGEHSWKTR